MNPCTPGPLYPETLHTYVLTIDGVDVWLERDTGYVLLVKGEADEWVFTWEQDSDLLCRADLEYVRQAIQLL